MKLPSPLAAGLLLALGTSPLHAGPADGPAASDPLDSQLTGTIQGQVTHGTTGRAIASAQVFVEDTQMGTTTDAEGNYTIANVPAGETTLVVQIIGFARETAEVAVVSGETLTQDFRMTERALSLEEMVVTGLTEETERANVPFSVGRVSQDQLPVPPRSAVGALQARVPGANVVQSSRPGTSDNIMLRTPTSAHRSNSPLFVVDGAILTSSDVDISSLDIESIEVVRGAAAASLYGSRAAAGVVQIRTVRGSNIPDGQTQLRIRSEYGSSSIANPIGWAQHHNFRMDDAGNFLDDDGNVVDDRFLATTTRYGFQDQEYPHQIYDNIAAFFNPGASQTHQITLGHNDQGTNWLVTAGRQSDAGVIRGHDGYQRTDVRLNVDHRPREDLNVSVSAFHMRSERDDLPGNTFFDFIQLAPDVDLLQPDEDGTPYVFQPDPFGIRVNPLYRIHTQERESRRTRTLASADMRYYPMQDVSVDVNVSYDRSDRLSTVWVPRGVKTSNRPDGDDGSLSRSSGLTDGLNASIGLAGTRHFGNLRARGTFRGITEHEYNHSVSASGSNLAVGGIPDLGTPQSVSIGSGESTIRSEGLLGTTELSYDDRYIVNMLIRRDGSSLFGANERWHTYYRASGAWRMAAESWFPFDDVNEFRLRYSRGSAGGRPNFSDRFEVFSVGSGGTLSLGNLGNRALKPETTTEEEFGIDVVTHDRVTVEMVYARQTTEDQLIQVPLPRMFGFNNQWQNAGTISGNTVEVQVHVAMMERPGFSWTAGLVADRSRNRIAEYNRPCFMSGNQYWCEGEQIGTMWGEKFAEDFDEIGHLHGSGSRGAFDVNNDGLLVAVGEGNSWRDGVSGDLWGSTVTVDGREYEWGMPIMLIDEDGQRQNVHIGDGNADLNLGLSNHARWGALRLYALVDTQIGGNVYNRTKQRMYQWARSSDQDQVGLAEEEKKPLRYYANYLYNVNRRNAWFVEDASFARLREVSVSYDVDPARFSFLNTARMDRMSLSLVGRNLLYLTDYSGYDPSVGSPMNRDDNFAYPSYRTITASVEIQF